MLLLNWILTNDAPGDVMQESQKRLGFYGVIKLWSPHVENTHTAVQMVQ